MKKGITEHVKSITYDECVESMFTLHDNMFMDNMILYLNANAVLYFGKCSKKLYKVTMSAMKNKHILKVMLNGPKNKNDKAIYTFQYDDKVIETIMTSLWDNKYTFIFLSTYINIRKYFTSCGKPLKHESECVHDDDFEDNLMHYNDDPMDNTFTSCTLQECVKSMPLELFKHFNFKMCQPTHECIVTEKLSSQVIHSHITNK